jgi:hypothetical protein
MGGIYEVEGFFAVLRGHKIVEATHTGMSSIAAAPDPVYGHAHDGATYDRQIHSRVAGSDSAPVLSGNDIEPEVKTGFDPPVPAVSPKHLLGTHLCGEAGGEQVFGFDFFGRFALAVNAAGQSSGLLGKRKIDAAGGGVKSNDAARFNAAAVEFTGLGS